MKERPEVRFYLDQEGIVLRVVKNSPKGETSLRLQWDFGARPRLNCETKGEIPIAPYVFTKVEDDLRAMASAFLFTFLRKEAFLLAFLQKEEKEAEAVCNRFCTWNSGSPEIVRWGLRTGETVWIVLTPEDKETNLRLAERLAKTLLTIARRQEVPTP
jgi:hypothetical protein